MVVQRRHLENAFAAQFERRHLDHHRQALGYEDTADENQKQFLLDNHGHGADRAAKRKRAHVAHENFGRVCVVPEETEAGPDHRAAEDR